MKIFSQLKSALLEKLGADPAFAASEEGRVIYNTVDKVAKINNGTEYLELGAGAGFITVSKTVLNTGDTLNEGEQALCDSTGGAFGLNLPAIAADGDRIRIIDAEKNFGTNNVTITPNGVETIDGGATLVMDVPYGHIELIANGTDWEVAALYSGGGATYSPATTSTYGLVKIPSGEVQVSLGGSGAAGLGTVGTKIRRFTTSNINTGTSITYADSATAGSSFTINEDGIYSIVYQDKRSGGSVIHGVSINAPDLTQAISFLTLTNRLNFVSGTTNSVVTCSITVPLSSGDVVRPHVEFTDTTWNTTDDCNFRITQIAKL